VIKKFRGFLLECLRDKQVRDSEEKVELYFGEGTQRGVCAFCGDEDEVSHRFLALMLREKTSHPALLQGDGPVCGTCAFVLHAVGKVTGIPYFFFTTNEERAVPLESVEDLRKAKPMDAVFFVFRKGQRLPTLFRCIPSPLPERSITLNVINEAEYQFFHATPGELKSSPEGRDFRSMILRSLNRRFGGGKR
jgi:hypothetical protein